MTVRLLTLDDVALTGDAKKVPYTPHGYIIDADARIHALIFRWYHGVVTALLYPEIAKDAGVPVPANDDEGEEVDVFAYQAFEHDHASRLPILRISQSQLTGSTLVSTGNLAPTDAQLTALVAILAGLGLRGTDTLTGEEDDLTVNALVEELRQKRVPPVDDRSNAGNEETL